MALGRGQMKELEAGVVEIPGEPFGVAQATGAERVGDPVMGVARSTLQGLLAVGVDPEAAFAPYLGRMSGPDLVDLAVDAFRDGFTCGRVLYEVSRGFEDKGAFARCCLSRGLSPLTPVMCAPEGADVEALVAGSGLPASMVEGLVRSLRRARPSDRVILNCSDFEGWDGVVPGAVYVASRYGLYVGCPGDASPSTLRFEHLEVQGTVEINAHASKLELVGLKRVMEDFYVSHGKDVVCPELEFVGGSVDVSDCKVVELQALEKVGGRFDGDRLCGLKCEKLSYVGGGVAIAQAKNIDLSSLVAVGGHLVITKAEDVRLDCLEKVVDGFHWDKAWRVVVPRLTSINGVTVPADRYSKLLGGA